MHRFGENVTLSCVILPSGTYIVTWIVPEDSTSLDRGTRSITPLGVHRLMFEAFEDDNGDFSCQIEDGTISDPVTVTVGNALPLIWLKTLLCLHSSRNTGATPRHDFGVQQCVDCNIHLHCFWWRWCSADVYLDCSTKWWNSI